MATDLQIIDGFERLRQAFLRENPGYLDFEGSVWDEDPPADRILAAWLQARADSEAQTGEQRRRIRALIRAIRGGTSAAYAPTPEDEAQIAEGRIVLERLPELERERLWPLGDPPRERTMGEEARLWQRKLDMTPLRAWRLMERLGRPVVVGEAPVRRLLWRLGMIEEQTGREQDLCHLQSVAEKIGVLTSLPLEALGRLLRWQSQGERNWEGGRLCGAEPRCVACPLGGGCAYARFHPLSAERVADSRPPLALEPLRRQIIANKQDQMTEAELLATLLQGGSGSLGAYELAEALIARFGGLKGLERARVVELTAVRGINRARAIQIKSALELGRRFAARALRAGDPIGCSEDIWQAFRSRFRDLTQEHFVILLLDSKNRVIHDHVVSKGTLTGSAAHPREVFQEAIRQAAASIILMHNHPSGDPSPSPEDRAVTTRLREAGEILGIKVLDHIILGADDYYSFTDES